MVLLGRQLGVEPYLSSSCYLLVEWNLILSYHHCYLVSYPLLIEECHFNLSLVEGDTISSYPLNHGYCCF